MGTTYTRREIGETLGISESYFRKIAKELNLEPVNSEGVAWLYSEETLQRMRQFLQAKRDGAYHVKDAAATVAIDPAINFIQDPQGQDPEAARAAGLEALKWFQQSLPECGQLSEDKRNSEVYQQVLDERYKKLGLVEHTAISGLAGYWRFQEPDFLQRPVLESEPNAVDLLKGGLTRFGFRPALIQPLNAADFSRIFNWGNLPDVANKLKRSTHEQLARAANLIHNHFPVDILPEPRKVWLSIIWAVVVSLEVLKEEKGKFDPFSPETGEVLSSLVATTLNSQSTDS